MKEFVCSLCPRNCGALRGETGRGRCGMGAEPRIARAAPHYDEEPVISGTRGAGTVFFSGCSLQCCFCQNYELSHEGFGKTVSVERLREIYFELIAQGVHNIDLVNPTHFANAIYESLEGGLPVPVVWNSGGYEKVETLRRFEGRVQVYLPDLKYIRANSARRYSGAADYFEYAAPAIREMLRQTGPVELDEDGVIRRDCSVRVVRDGIVIHEGSLASLKRFKDDAKEVAENYECGMTVEKFNDIKEGDIIEAFTMEEIPQ